ncbi:hypothetical protein Apa02nite_099310 [Actinoplanes palleronii]|uniref:Secreted protein n=1 Tax=Actinoplanes palleronii TaxID=113570 RepID=A0ABQ4BT12_9ACTN|nr:hypothetical protein Apa02nite_099310 [Actinoplanes palleronii]
MVAGLPVLLVCGEADVTAADGLGEADGELEGVPAVAEVPGVIPPTGSAAPFTCSGLLEHPVIRDRPATVAARTAIVRRIAVFPVFSKLTVLLSLGAMRGFRL